MKRLVAFLLVIVMCLGTVLPGIADTIHIPSGTKTIDEESFYGDTSLDEVIIPEGVETIGDRAFAGSSLHRITLPSSLDEIGDDAFPQTATIDAPIDSAGYLWASSNNYELETEYTEEYSIPVDSTTFNGHTYRIFDEYFTWDRAQIECLKAGGHLAVITSQEEYNFLYNYINDSGSRIVYWIGLSCSSRDDGWQWINGEPYEFHPESCLFDYWGPAPYAAVFLNADGYKGKWADLQYDGVITGDTSGLWRFTSNFGFICEWDGEDDYTETTSDSLFLNEFENTELLPTEGIEDAEFLQLVIDANADIIELNNLQNEFNAAAREYNAALQELMDAVPEYSIAEEENNLILSNSDIELSIDKNVDFSSDVVDVAYEDGHIVCTTSDGNAIYLSQNGNSMSVSSIAPVQSDVQPPESAGSSKLVNTSENIVTLSSKYAEAAQSISIDTIGRMESKIEIQNKRISKLRADKEKYPVRQFGA